MSKTTGSLNLNTNSWYFLVVSSIWTTSSCLTLSFINVSLPSFAIPYNLVPLSIEAIICSLFLSLLGFPLLLWPTFNFIFLKYVPSLSSLVYISFTLVTSPPEYLLFLPEPLLLLLILSIIGIPISFIFLSPLKISPFK